MQYNCLENFGTFADHLSFSTFKYILTANTYLYVFLPLIFLLLPWQWSFKFKLINLYVRWEGEKKVLLKNQYDIFMCTQGNSYKYAHYIQINRFMTNENVEGSRSGDLIDYLYYPLNNIGKIERKCLIYFK